MQGERPAWRHEAEETCLKSGAVKIGVVQAEPIEGPGMCGADFPIKVSALGEAPAMSYGDDLRPPASIPNAGSDMPRWPAGEPRSPRRPPRVAPVQSAPVHGETLRWVPGPPGVDIQREGAPMSLSPGGDAAPQASRAARSPDGLSA